MEILERIRLAMGGAMIGALVSGVCGDLGLIPDTPIYDTIGAAVGFAVFYRAIGIEPIKI